MASITTPCLLQLTNTGSEGRLGNATDSSPCTVSSREASFYRGDTSFSQTFGGRRRAAGHPVLVLRTPSASFRSPVNSLRQGDGALLIRWPDRSRPVHRSREPQPNGVHGFRTYEVVGKVRAYELDRNGMVDGPTYAHYCEHARHELFEQIGFGPDVVARTGHSLAISDFTMKFQSPLRKGDQYVVRVYVTKISGARIFMEHVVYKLPSRAVVLEALGTAVYYDKDYRPAAVPEEMRVKLLRCSVPCNPATN